MKMTTATRVAALAVGLSLAGAQAFAAPADGGRRGHDDNNAATQQQDQNDRGDRNHRRKKLQDTPAANAPAVNPTPVIQAQPQDNGRRDARQRRDANHVNDNRRGRSHQANDRRNDNDGKWRNNDRRRDFGDRNDRRRDFGDRNDRRDWGNQDRRRAVNVTRYNRNFNAPRRFHVDRYRAHRGYSYRRYSYGQHLPNYYYGRNFWLSNFLVYGLFSPPPGYVWVRYGPDALLIDEETGEIVQVRYNMFYS
jgi:Ni/Co efflux regulator RcnB